jgi:hypothetical protein
MAGTPILGIDGQRSDPDSGDEDLDGANDRGHGCTSSDSGPAGNPSETRSRQECYESLISGGSSEGGVVARPWETAKPAVERREWQAPLAEGSVDRIGLGVIDERAKRFSPAERRIAEYVHPEGQQ